MAKSTTGKWVSRVGSSGGGKAYKKTRPSNYYGILIVIVVLGLATTILARYDYQHPASAAAGTPPAIGTTWFAAVSIEACGETLPYLKTDANISGGLKVLSDNVMQITPVNAADSGKNATLAQFGVEFPGLILSSSELAIPSAAGVANASTTYRNGEQCPASSKYPKKVGHIVFKAHPWERQKQGVNQPLTKDVIERFRADELEERDRERLQIVEGFNIHGLFDQSDYVLTLSSQASLEAAMCGLKPVQFGKAFYGHKGFTHDYDSVCKFVADLVAGNVSGKLTLEEYDCFEEFLMKALEFHLVSAHRSGVRRLKAIFIPKRLPRLSAPIMSGLAETFTPQPSSPAANYFTDIVLTTHEGKPVRFYADLLKGQIVVINVFCFGCCGSCEATMGFLKCLHRHSGAARGTKIRFLSISVDPKNSTPEKLKSYATALEVEPGWSFLTGDKETIGFVLGKLGVPADEREHHSGVLIVGGESAGVWKKSRDAAPSHEIQKAIEAVVDSGKFDALTVSLFEDLKIEVINT